MTKTRVATRDELCGWCGRRIRQGDTIDAARNRIDHVACAEQRRTRAKRAKSTARESTGSQGRRVIRESKTH